MTSNASVVKNPGTQIFECETGVFMLPDWAHEHITSGHTDPKQATGSVFLPHVDVTSLITDMLTGNVKNQQANGAVVQAEAAMPVGWNALTTAQNVTGALLKFESPVGSRSPSLVLAPAIINTAFGSENTQTSMYSMIAPVTSNSAFVPSDVKDDVRVAKALANGKLHTIVSLYPGNCIVAEPAINAGLPVPKTSELNFDLDSLVFQAHPDNAAYIPMEGNTKTIIEFIDEFNAGSLLRNARDEGKGIGYLKMLVQMQYKEFLYTLDLDTENLGTKLGDLFGLPADEALAASGFVRLDPVESDQIKDSPVL